MPCPGSDKAFYKEVGLAPAKSVPTTNSVSAAIPAIVTAPSTVQATSNMPMAATSGPAKSNPFQGDCKPQIHKKTGGTLPCPAPD